MNPTCIAIVTPTYNGAKYLPQTIASVRAQTLSDWQWTLVDDGSTDNTVALASEAAWEDSRIRVLTQSNGGVAAARNRGIAEAAENTEFLALLDHDDVWEPVALERLLRALGDDSQAVAAHGLARFLDGDGRPVRSGEAEALARGRKRIENGDLRDMPRDHPTDYATLAFNNCIHTPGQVLMRMSHLRAVGPLDPETVPSDDYDLWLRLAARGHLAFLDEVVLNFRQHSSNQSRAARRMTETEMYVRRKQQDAPYLTPEQRVVAADALRAWQSYMRGRWLGWAGESLRRGDVLNAARQARHALLAGRR